MLYSLHTTCISALLSALCFVFCRLSEILSAFIHTEYIRVSVISVWNRITRSGRELSIYCSLDLSAIVTRERESFCVYVRDAVCVCVYFGWQADATCLLCSSTALASYRVRSKAENVPSRYVRVCPSLLHSFAPFVTHTKLAVSFSHKKIILNSLG